MVTAAPTKGVGSMIAIAVATADRASNAYPFRLMSLLAISPVAPPITAARIQAEFRLPVLDAMAEGVASPQKTQWMSAGKAPSP